MASEYHVLGTINSSGIIGTADTFLTCDADSVVISTVSVCNTAATSATYRVAVSTTVNFEDAGYIVYDATVPANDTIFLTLGIVLDPTNFYMLCSASAATVCFTAFGIVNNPAGGGAE